MAHVNNSITVVLGAGAAKSQEAMPNMLLEHIQQFPNTIYYPLIPSSIQHNTDKVRCNNGLV
jgi:hypothetical protein